MDQPLASGDARARIAREPASLPTRHAGFVMPLSFTVRADRAFRAGEYDNALALYQAAADSAAGAAVRASNIKNVGVVLRSLGRCDEARSRVREAESVVPGREIGVRAEIELLKANLFLDADDPERAVDPLQRAVDLFRRAHRATEAVQAILTFATAVAKLGRTRAAIELLESVHPGALPPELQSQVLNNLGVLYLGEADMERAQSLFVQDAQLCLRIGDRYGRALALINLGRAMLAAGESENARQVLTEGLRTLSVLGIHRDANAVKLATRLLAEARS